MDASSLPYPVEELLASTAWLRRLARTLVRDEHAAEDLVQEAWLVGLARRGRPDELRAWLAGVVRRLALRQRREREARARRETHAARPEAGPPGDPGRWLAEAELQQRLLAAVLALPEPTRAAIVARFLQGVSAATIARRDGVPESTVRTRIQRGLADLRRALDREFGSRSAWAALALPSGALVPAAAVLAGGIALVAASTLAVVGVRAALGAPRTVEPDAPRVMHAAGTPADPADDGPAPARSARPAREPLHAAPSRAPVVALEDTEEPEEVEPEPPDGWHLAGRVLDPRGEPLAGATVLYSSPGIPFDERLAIETGPDGRYAFDFESGDAARAARVVGVVHPRYLPEYSPLSRARRRFEQGVLHHDVTLRAAHRARFQVTDQDGLPLEGAWIVLADASANHGRSVPDDHAAEPTFAWRTLFSGGRRLDAKTDGGGYAEFENAPPGELGVTVSAPGYLPVELTRLRADRPPFVPRTVALTRGQRLSGSVRDHGGRPVAGAEVTVLAASIPVRATSGPDGAFELVGLPTGPVKAEVLVTHPELAPWHRSGWGAEALVLDGSPLAVEMQPGRTLELLLVDASTGRPIDGFVTAELGSSRGALSHAMLHYRGPVSGGNLLMEHAPEDASSLWVDVLDRGTARVRLDERTGDFLRVPIPGP